MYGNEVELLRFRTSMCNECGREHTGQNPRLYITYTGYVYYDCRQKLPTQKDVYLFFFNHTPTTEIYTLSLHDALPILKKTLGLELANISDDLRRRYKIKDTVKGVVITGVDASSAAADKRLSPGDVIVEIAQEAVASKIGRAHV